MKALQLLRFTCRIFSWHFLCGFLAGKIFSESSIACYSRVSAAYVCGELVMGLRAGGSAMGHLAAVSIGITAF
jgi:hypothetical protein